MQDNWTPLPLSIPDLQGTDSYLTEIKIAAKRVCIAKNKGKWHAFDARCPHAGGPFADGYFDEAGKVICPWHRFAFDPVSGQCESGGGYYIDTYPIREREGRLWIRFKKKKPWWKVW